MVADEGWVGGVSGWERWDGVEMGERGIVRGKGVKGVGN